MCVKERFMTLIASHSYGLGLLILMLTLWLCDYHMFCCSLKELFTHNCVYLHANFAKTHGQRVAHRNHFPEARKMPLHITFALNFGLDVMICKKGEGSCRYSFYLQLHSLAAELGKLCPETTQKTHTPAWFSVISGTLPNSCLYTQTTM